MIVSNAKYLPHITETAGHRHEDQRSHGMHASICAEYLRTTFKGMRIVLLDADRALTAKIVDPVRSVAALKLDY